LIKPYYETEFGKLYHGDCREILPQLIEEVDLVLSDPPYGGNLSVDFADRFGRKPDGFWKNTDRSSQARHVPIVGDDKPFDPEVLLNITSRAKVLWGANWYASKLPDRGGWWIWDKRNGKRDVSGAEWPMSEAELAWTTIGKGVRIYRHTWFGLIRDSERGEYYHPTQKPISLMCWCIEKAKSIEGLILDPFLGSGTTAVACERLGRKWIGVEISKEYCDIAVKRIKQERSQLKLDLV
jgi:DNA modification methylase